MLQVRWLMTTHIIKTFVKSMTTISVYLTWFKEVKKISCNWSKKSTFTGKRAVVKADYEICHSDHWSWVVAKNGNCHYDRICLGKTQIVSQEHKDKICQQQTWQYYFFWRSVNVDFSHTSYAITAMVLNVTKVYQSMGFYIQLKIVAQSKLRYMIWVRYMKT